jgi:extracellular factor (EF) 3-hydroxypalmitic acid methyl ester biosynthesis protein
MSVSSNAAAKLRSVSFDIGAAIVTGRAGEGQELRAALLRVSRREATLELYGPETVLRVSEAIADFVIEYREREVYAGKAVVRSLVETGTKVICQIELTESGWVDPEFQLAAHTGGDWAKEYRSFSQDWQEFHRILPDYKIVVSDLYSYLSGLQLWLEQMELRLFKSPSGKEALYESEAILEVLLPKVTEGLGYLFARFEEVSATIAAPALPAHREFGKRQLNPLLLTSPFMFRTYAKPLGYAGDYEMMSMIVRQRCQGKNLFARLVDGYLLAQHPCEAVRNRVGYLKTRILEESLRLVRARKTADIFCVACGPAWEAVQFIAEQAVADHVTFHLLDFNAETLAYADQIFANVIKKHGRRTRYSLVKNSVHNLLRANARATSPAPKYDLIYCSGLYDYLSDRVCQSLNDHLYNLLRPED